MEESDTEKTVYKWMDGLRMDGFQDRWMEDWIDIKDDDGGRVKEKKKIGIGERGRGGEEEEEDKHHS